MQIPLSLNLRDDVNFENFYTGTNTQIVETLKTFITHTPEPFIYCYGESGSGRTHLLQACCHLAHQCEKSIFYLPLSQYENFSLDIFQELERYQIVCLDDIDAIIGSHTWEEAVFHFYNRAREQKTALLVSAICVPKHLNCLLPDLQSRLAWSLTLEIKNLSDEEKINVLQLRAARRGFDLSNEVALYLIHHHSRHMGNLFSLLEKLDHASLIAKRKITVPFVKRVV